MHTPPYIYTIVVEGPKPKFFRIAAPDPETAKTLVTGYNAFVEAVRLAEEIQKQRREDN
jgi:hypothetical protein